MNVSEGAAQEIHPGCVSECLDGGEEVEQPNSGSKKSVHPWKFGVVFVTTRQGQDHGSGNSTNEGKVHNGMVARIRPMVPWP